MRMPSTQPAAVARRQGPKEPAELEAPWTESIRITQKAKDSVLGLRCIWERRHKREHIHKFQRWQNSAHLEPSRDPYQPARAERALAFRNKN